MEIFSLSPSLIDDLLVIENDCFTHPWTRKMFEDELVNPLARYCILDVGGEKIGYIGMWHVSDELHITNIAVKKAYRRRGFGELLMNEALSYFNAENIKTLYLEVRVSNFAAYELYKKLGFREIGIRRNYYKNPAEDAVMMCVEKENG